MVFMRRVKSVLAGLQLSAFASVSVPPASIGAQAAQTSVVYSFTGGTKGERPSSLVEDGDGNFVGTAGTGGPQNPGFGLLFKVTRAGHETVLHQFQADGRGFDPGPLIYARGRVYGTTLAGTHTPQCDVCGKVFVIAPNGVFRVLYSFSVFKQGARPSGLLAVDRQGDVFGTATGGAFARGVVFKIAPDGTETVLHAFKGIDGAGPNGLIIDAAGNLYGTTFEGGRDNAGTIFKITPDGHQTVLHHFQRGRGMGSNPQSGVIMDKAGNLFGTAYHGGDDGMGSIFKLSPDGKLFLVYSFGGTRGAFPYAGLIMDAQGNLFGTTLNGGSPVCDCGVVFKVTQAGQGFVLHRFGRTDGVGFNPSGNLILDSAGDLFGVALNGGASGKGTIYKVAN